MVTREEAKDISLVVKGDTFKVHVMIDKIYDSRGSCNECISCKYEPNASLAECILYGCLKMPDGYCDEFTRREDDT